MINREGLTKIIEAEDGINWWVPERFEANIRNELPSELEIVAPPPIEEKNYNCFVYAFGLHNDSNFLGGKNPIQKEFVRYLIVQGELKSTEQKNNALIFYEDVDLMITHVGIMQGSGKVISKWMWGSTFVHGIWDVPSSFGNKILIFNSISANQVKQLYKQYKDSGVTIQPIQ